MAEEIIIEKKSPQVLRIVLAVVISAIIFGLLGYYLGKRAKTEVPETPIDETAMINQTGSLKSPTITTKTATPTAAVSNSIISSNWKNYLNSKYNFSLEFNDKWTGLRVYDVKSESNEDISPASDRYYYCIPTTSTKWTDRISGFACPFAINVFTVSTYDSENQKAQQEQGLSAVNGNELGRNNDYVFLSSQWQDRPDDLDAKGIPEDVKNITGSFTVK